MKTFKFLSSSFGFSLLLAIMAIGCQKNVSVKPGGSTALQVFLTDDQSLVFDKVNIDVLKVEVKTEDHDSLETGDDHGDDNGDDNGGNSGGDDHGGNGGGGGIDDPAGDDHGGWTALDINPGVYDLLQLRNGVDTLLGTGSFPTAHNLRKARISLGTRNSVEVDGNSFPLHLHNNNNTVTIKLDESSMIVNGAGQISFWLDFDAGRSIRFQDGQYELDSRIRAFCEEKAGSIEGRVSPLAANPIVYAISGTDTLTARPGHEGEFKFVGLKPVIYSLWIDATSGSYQDQTVTGIAVSKGEDTHVPEIILH